MIEQFLTNQDKFNKDLSSNLSLLLKENNISESDLARALNLPYNTIHRLINGHTTDPRISTLKSIAEYFNVSIDFLFNPGLSQKKIYINKNFADETLLHYILKQSHHLYPVSKLSSIDYADFVLSLLREINTIDTSNENLLKIIDLAISSISFYKEKQYKQNLTL